MGVHMCACAFVAKLGKSINAKTIQGNGQSKQERDNGKAFKWFNGKIKIIIACLSFGQKARENPESIENPCSVRLIKPSKPIHPSIEEQKSVPPLKINKFDED